MSNRPDWLKCIRHTHVEKERLSWCGRDVGKPNALGCEWTFVNLDHAAYANANGTRLLPCPACVKVACAALRPK